MTAHETASPKKRTPFDYTLSVIGGKWSMKLMYQLAINGVTRYGGLKRSIPEITHKVFTSHLRGLEEQGVIQRVEYQENISKVEYSLTAKGATLIPVLEHLCKWGLDNGPEQAFDMNFDMNSK